MLLLLAACFFRSDAQETFRYMSYNLLYYGTPYDVCSESNNNVSDKDGYLRTLFDYARPDLFAVCEMIPGNSNAQRLLDSVINATSAVTFSRTLVTNYSGGDLINMLYYDPEKFALVSQDAIITDLRDINLYHFYLRTSDLASTQDTIRLSVIIAHLKAGTGSSNEQRRATMTATLMNYLQAQNQPGNVILSGDFNFYTSTEQGYQTLVNFGNAAFRFHDPIDMPGNWNSDPAYAGIHTQSTHASSNGCAAGGGLDDRFDFILVSPSLMAGTLGMQCDPLTYHALGQDGQHFNQSVNGPGINTSAPQEVIEALFGNSDHLPVIMDIQVAKSLSVNELPEDPAGILLVNPARGNLAFTMKNPPSCLRIDVLDPVSRQAAETFALDHLSGSVSLPLPALATGLYLARFILPDGRTIVKKLVIN